MADNLQPRQVGERIEHLLTELVSADSSVGARAEELVGLLVKMYGDGLTRVIGGLGEIQVRELVSDPAISALLVLHDLHPDDTATRVNAALDGVRPYLGSHAGGVEFLGVTEGGEAQLALRGSCDGCPASSITVKMAIEGAILDAAPEIVSVHVEGVAEVEPGPPAVPGLVQIGEKPKPKTTPTWVELEGVSPLPGTMELRTLGTFDFVLAATDDFTYAYRGDCPGCGAEMITGSLVGTMLSCASCGRSYDLAQAGRSASDDLLLNPIPSLKEDGVVKIAVPEVVG